MQSAMRHQWWLRRANGCPKAPESGSDSLEAISQITKQDDDAAQSHESEVVLHLPLVAHHQPPEVTQPSEQPLDLPAPLVASELATVLCLGLLPVPSMRSEHLYAPLCECLIERVRGIGAV